MSIIMEMKEKVFLLLKFYGMGGKAFSSFSCYLVPEWKTFFSEKIPLLFVWWWFKLDCCWSWCFSGFWWVELEKHFLMVFSCFAVWENAVDRWEYSHEMIHGTLNTIFKRHQQRIHVFKALELRLINLLDDALVVWRQMNGLVGEFWGEVCEVLSEKSKVKN